MRHKGWKNGPGTNRRTDLTLLPGHRIGRNHWHARKRQQTVLVPLKHDWDTLMLQGAAMKEVQERGIKVISKGPRFDKMNKIKREKK